MYRKDSFRICLFDLVWSKKNPGDIGLFLISGEQFVSSFGIYKTTIQENVRNTSFFILNFGTISSIIDATQFSEVSGSNDLTYSCRGLRLAVSTTEHLTWDGVSLIGELSLQFSGDCVPVDDSYVLSNRELMMNCADFTEGIPSTYFTVELFDLVKILENNTIVKPKAELPMGSSANLELVINRLFYLYAAFWPESYAQDKRLVLNELGVSLRENMSSRFNSIKHQTFTMATGLVIDSFINEVQSVPHLVKRLTILKQLLNQFVILYIMASDLANTELKKEVGLDYSNSVKELYSIFSNNQELFSEIQDLTEGLVLLVTITMIDVKHGMAQIV